MRLRPSRTGSRPTRSGQPAELAYFDAADTEDDIEIAHRGCVLCANGTDHVASVGREQSQ